MPGPVALGALLVLPRLLAALCALRAALQSLRWAALSSAPDGPVTAGGPLAGVSSGPAVTGASGGTRSGLSEV